MREPRKRPQWPDALLSFGVFLMTFAASALILRLVRASGSILPLVTALGMLGSGGVLAVVGISERRRRAR